MTIGITVPDDSVTEREAARILEVPLASLRKWRITGMLRDGLVRGKMSGTRTAPVLYWRSAVEAARELADPVTSEDAGGILRREAVLANEAAPHWVPTSQGNRRGAATESESAAPTVPDDVEPDTVEPRQPIRGISF